MDSILNFIIFDRINRIFRIFFQAFLLPAIASRSGEAGGDESLETLIAFGEKQNYSLKFEIMCLTYQ